MKNKKYILSLMACTGLLAASCTPDEYSLGEVGLSSADLVEGINYTVTVDQSTNTVEMKSNLDAKYSIFWEYDGGRASGTTATAQYPFEGDKYVRMGVMTRGGVVWSDTTWAHIDQLRTELLQDEIWTYVTGGVGKSKTWRLDLTADGKTTSFFKGPIWFWTLGYSWDALHTSAGLSYMDDDWSAADAISPFLADDGTAQWYWAADYAGNSWVCGAADYGTMTFDLINGAHVNVNQSGAASTGSFVINTADHSLVVNDAVLLCPDNRTEAVKRSTYSIIYANDNFLQILVNDASDTPISLNYVWEGYEEPVEETFSPLPTDWLDYIEPKNNKEITYKFNVDTPFDFFTYQDSLLGVSGKYTAVDGLEDATLVLNSGTKAYTMTTPAGDIYEGTYSHTDAGVYTFSPALPTFDMTTDGSIVFGSNDDGSLQLISFATDDFSGNVTDMWFVKSIKDGNGKVYEFMAFNIAPQMGGASTPKYPASLHLFDSSFSFLDSEQYVENEGSYTFTITADGTSTIPSSPYGLYFDVSYKCLKAHPNMDIVITSIKADGVDVTFDDTALDRTDGDTYGKDTPDARRYIINPWAQSYDPVAFAETFKFTKQLDVTFNIIFDNGKAWKATE